MRQPHLFIACCLILCAQYSQAAPPLAQKESFYADWRDAHHAVATLVAGSAQEIDGSTLGEWEQRLATARAAFLTAPSPTTLNPLDNRALALMNADVAAADGAESLLSRPAASTDQCAQASTLVTESALVRALYDCFSTLGNHLQFEGQTLTRTSALELLHELPESSRREALFRSFNPLWQALNGTNSPASPYRRLVRATVASRTEAGDRIDAAARTVGTDRLTVKRWLTQVLQTWAELTEGPEVEPWDYWSAHTAVTQRLDRELDARSMAPLAARYFHDLGADLDRLKILQDLVVRPGKAPLAYTDYVRIGRRTANGWRPARVRVSANIEKGGIYIANELIHEDGHAVHMMALRTRPAFFDLGDAVFYEAFADVPSWSVASPSFQARYFGIVLDPAASAEALYAGVMLDVAWGLFEIEMLDAPEADPNLVWTNITQRYLHIRPHPELSWWALRVQLVHAPGYMINYGLGAVITAELRARTERTIGPFDAGNPRWYAWTSQHLLKGGETVETAALLKHFLNRPVSASALLAALGAVRH